MRRLFFPVIGVMLVMVLGGCSHEKTACEFCREYRLDNFSKTEFVYDQAEKTSIRRSFNADHLAGEDYYSYWNESGESDIQVNQLIKSIYYKDQKFVIKQDGNWTFEAELIETFLMSDGQESYSVELTFNETGTWIYKNESKNYVNFSRKTATIESIPQFADQEHLEFPITDFPFYKKWTYQDEMRPFELLYDADHNVLTIASLIEDETIHDRSLLTPSYSICEGNVYSTMIPYEGNKLTQNKE
ncbi:MAG: hypothetical protein ACPG21_07355 [Crocinitomicaceae bacterium]